MQILCIQNQLFICHFPDCFLPPRLVRVQPFTEGTFPTAKKTGKGLNFFVQCRTTAHQFLSFLLELPLTLFHLIATFLSQLVAREFQAGYLPACLPFFIFQCIQLFLIVPGFFLKMASQLNANLLLTKCGNFFGEPYPVFIPRFLSLLIHIPHVYLLFPIAGIQFISPDVQFIFTGQHSLSPFILKCGKSRLYLSDQQIIFLQHIPISSGQFCIRLFQTILLMQQGCFTCHTPHHLFYAFFLIIQALFADTLQIVGYRPFPAHQLVTFGRILASFFSYKSHQPCPLLFCFLNLFLEHRQHVMSCFLCIIQFSSTFFQLLLRIK